MEKVKSSENFEYHFDSNKLTLTQVQQAMRSVFNRDLVTAFQKMSPQLFRSAGITVDSTTGAAQFAEFSKKVQDLDPQLYAFVKII